MEKMEKINEQELLLRIRENKKIFGLSESFYLKDEWTEIKNISDVSYYKIYGKPNKQNKGQK